MPPGSGHTRAPLPRSKGGTPAIALSIVQIVHLWDDLVLEVVGAVQRAAELRPALLAPHDRVNILQTVTTQVTQHHEGVISIEYLK